MYIIGKADAQYEAELTRKTQTNNEIQVPISETESTTVDKVVSPQQSESDIVEKENTDQSTDTVTNQGVVVALSVESSVTNALIEPSISDLKTEETFKDSTECKEGT